MKATDPADELRRFYPPILTTAHVVEMMHYTIGDIRDKVHRKELPAMRWGRQFRFLRDEVLATMIPVDPGESPAEGEMQPEEMHGCDVWPGSSTYDRWYPELSRVMDTCRLVDLLNTNELIVHAWVREGIIPAHHKPADRKFTLLRHEIFDWLISNRYEPE